MSSKTIVEIVFCALLSFYVVNGASLKLLLLRQNRPLISAMSGPYMHPSSVNEPSPASPSPDEDETPIEFGFWRPGATFNDPRDIIVDTPEDCHRICEKVEGCVTWSRDRRTGACALKDSETPFTRDDNFDSGVIDGVRASGSAVSVGCFVETGARYASGTILSRTQTDSAETCCQLCRNFVDCFSWHRSRRTGRCVMNRNIPNRNSNSAFDGAALI